MNSLPSAPSEPATDTAEAPAEQIAPDVTRSWLFNKQIVVFKVTSVSRSAVDAWINSVKETMQHWPKGQPYLAIHDLTSEKVSLTPYARARAQELLPLSTSAPGYAALLLPNSFVAQVIRLFMRTQRQQGNENQIFFTRDEAVIWLQRKASTFKLP